jgi:uncharacterized protein YkwD
MRRIAAVLTALALAVVPAAAGQAHPAKHVRTYDKNLLKYVNHARKAHGLKPFKESARLYAVAHKWAVHMAKTHQLGDDPSWTAGGQYRKVCPKATTAGANDGWQGKTSAKGMFEQYKAEPFHWANLQSPRYNPHGQPAYTDVGIATVAVKNGDGTTSEWNSMYFANHCA